MALKKHIVRKVVLTIIWSMVSAGAIVLLVAATRQQSQKICEDVIVKVKSVDGVQYISEKQILNTISGGRPDLMKGQLIKTFDLSQLENLLEANLWIRNAELFFDNKDVLHINIIERQPVARIFSLSGESFYVDDMGEQLPVTADQIARVPVFTSFPTITKPLQAKDSLLLMQIKETGTYLLKHSFWMAQIDQININNYEMEMIPKLGKHSILFGDGTKVEQKFNRLLLFYKQIMSKTGWNYYSTLDVRFDKQLVAVRRDSVSLFKSFVIPKDSIRISTIIDSINLARDSSLTILPVKKDSNKVLTSKTITPNLPSKALAKEEPKSDPVKKPVAAKVNAVKPQTPVKQKSLTDEEKILLEAKKKTEKPKAEMKKKEEN